MQSLKLFIAVTKESLIDYILSTNKQMNLDLPSFFFLNILSLNLLIFYVKYSMQRIQAVVCDQKWLSLTLKLFLFWYSKRQEGLGVCIPHSFVTP